MENDRLHVINEELLFRLAVIENEIHTKKKTKNQFLENLLAEKKDFEKHVNFFSLLCYCCFFRFYDFAFNFSEKFLCQNRSTICG